jgi:uncharacterized protein (TIGR00369 family)
MEEIFSQAPFIQSLGIRLGDLGVGWCETSLALEPRHLQQNGFVHAGVVATMADHTAGASAGSLAPEGKAVLTIEYKINLLRPGTGQALRCRAQVLRPGKRILVAESDVFATDGGVEKHIAKALVTLAVV